MSNFDYYEEFEALLNEYMPVKEDEEIKSKVTGIIVNMDRNFTYLEVPGEPKAVRVRTEELIGYSVGDEVEVLIVAQAEESDSLILIGSKRRIDMEIGAEQLMKAFENHEIVTGKISKRVKGGYIVELFHQQGFLPNSLSEISLEQGDSFVGKEISVSIKEIKEDRKGKKILLSRKEIIAAKELEAIDKLAVGEVVKVTVLEVLDFGLTVKLNGARGFIHISEVDWKKTADLHKLFKAGDIVEAKIIEIEREKRNIKLSIKALTRNPWDIIAENNNVGQEVVGKVTRIVNYGAFVELMPGVEGLVHSSDFSWTSKKVNVNNFVKVGDELKVSIIELNPAERKLKLGIKQLSSNPWEKAETKFAIGKVLTGTVVEVKPFGIFVQVEEGVDGFIHNSDFAWTGNKKYSKGDKVEFKVVELNLEDQKIKGSIKDLTKSPWETALENYKVGDRVEKEIKNIQDFGMFVKLEEGVDGFIPTQLASKDFIKNLKDVFTPGQTILAEIVEIDSEKKRIKLSMKKVQLEKEKNENKELIEKYGTSSSEE
ncbi:S1 RNA-binding domain-containing protein [Cetobacterium somerae]|uniref:S1 RNA-binding domain-containing protein n=1 Tax=Cetobacterium sp. NK01 TaxID=2993530 RepID=UPI0021168B9E|nr:S1 RNA-binding domain-containing protein [Cetobacterium sp. NK01]MCQ8211722.1 S1 RNA-binding domain-containing protein [Cetobacterium sp. NK01]